jgi:hypothetical protein
MRTAKRSAGAYGAASAIFSGVIACAFVVGASIFGQELVSVITDLTCEPSIDCTAPVATSAVPRPADSAGQVAVELDMEPPAGAVPATAMQTTH